jgi:AcrR family transcriptional regulator
VDERAFPAAEGGLRERKKAKTRALVQDVALRLFAEQGYEATTVTQIAAAAEVSPSTLFRYFETKADILRYDALDPILFDAYRKQSPDLRPMTALRGAARALLVQLPADVLDRQVERARLILSIPELRASSAIAGDEVQERLAEAETVRTGRRPDPFALAVCVGAIGGAITAALLGDPGMVPTDFSERLDLALRLVDEGLPL